MKEITTSEMNETQGGAMAADCLTAAATGAAVGMWLGGIGGALIAGAGTYAYCSW